MSNHDDNATFIAFSMLDALDIDTDEKRAYRAVRVLRVQRHDFSKRQVVVSHVQALLPLLL